MQTITVIIPAYNEKDYIQDCLQSVSFANQIILIDSFSSDNTVEIAKKFNCEILQRKFDNFSNQKNEAIKHASSDWILFVDADDYFNYELFNLINFDDSKVIESQLITNNYFIIN